MKLLDVLVKVKLCPTLTFESNASRRVHTLGPSEVQSFHGIQADTDVFLQGLINLNWFAGTGQHFIHFIKRLENFRIIMITFERILKMLLNKT